MWVDCLLRLESITGHFTVQFAPICGNNETKLRRKPTLYFVMECYKVQDPSLFRNQYTQIPPLSSTLLLSAAAGLRTGQYAIMKGMPLKSWEP